MRVWSEEFGVALDIDRNMERYTELRPSIGEAVFVSPRHVRVFMPEDFAI